MSTSSRISKVNKGELEELVKLLLFAFNDDPLYYYLSEGGPKPMELSPKDMKMHYERLLDCYNKGYLEKISADRDSKDREDIYSGFIMCYDISKKDLENSSDYISSALKVVSNLWRRLRAQKQPRIDIVNEVHDRALIESAEKFGDLFYLESISVAPNRQGLGLGKELMDRAMELSKEKPVFLECTDRANVPFYEKYGFVTQKEELLDESTPLIFMIRK